MRIAVLSGGISGEREVSLRSGRTVEAALRSLGHDVSMVDFGPGSAEELRALAPQLVFPALHGPLGEDGTAAALLEVLRLPYVGSGVLAGALAMNKAAAKRVLLAEGLPTPAFELIRAAPDEPLDYMGLPVRAADLVAKLGLPLAIKPNSGGSSLGVTIAHQEDAVLDGIGAALAEAGPDQAALVEAFKPGMEITIGIIGIREPEALPIIEITYRKGNYDYEAKYTAGMSGHVIPARLTPEDARAAADLALRAHKLLGARGLSRVDLIREPDGALWVLEVNTLPGLTELSLYPDAARAAGMEFPELVARLVAEASQA